MTKSIDLTNLHKKGQRINWEKSVGDTFTCVYNDKNYEFIIKDYMHLRDPYVYIYNCEEYQGWILTKSLKKCQFGRILKPLNKEYYYEVGEIIDNIQIIARRKNPKTGVKEYKIKCLLCGYDMSKHIAYRNQKLFKDKWRLENNIVQGKRCPCCCEPSQITVPGINDIPTTAPWMITYFQGGYDEAKMYTKRSSKYIYPKCPDCGRVKTSPVEISNLYHNHSIGCICSDKTSYPEKFFAEFLNQLNIPYEREFTFTGYKYRYDFIFYSVKKDELIIVETDGGIGHGGRTWSKSIQDSRKSLLIDFDKEILALSYGVPVVHIDCIKSDIDYISNNILNNDKLRDYIDISNVNWEECDKFATSNLHKKNMFRLGRQ